MVILYLSSGGTLSRNSRTAFACEMTKPEERRGDPGYIAGTRPRTLEENPGRVHVNTV